MSKVRVACLRGGADLGGERGEELSHHARLGVADGDEGQIDERVAWHGGAQGWRSGLVFKVRVGVKLRFQGPAGDLGTGVRLG